MGLGDALCLVELRISYSNPPSSTNASQRWRMRLRTLPDPRDGRLSPDRAANRSGGTDFLAQIRPLGVTSAPCEASADPTYPTSPPCSARRHRSSANLADAAGTWASAGLSCCSITTATRVCISSVMWRERVPIRLPSRSPHKLNRAAQRQVGELR
jgi:hypothetical protein